MSNDDRLRPSAPARVRWGIVPPHMLHEVIRRGNDEQRAWALDLLATIERHRGHRLALSGLAAHAPARARGKSRAIYDAQGGYDLPGTLVRGEQDPPSEDPAVNEAFDGLGATYDFYKQVYQRNSIDGRGMRLKASVHYGYHYDNAEWDGHQMIFGDGDGQIFGRFTQALDVIGHELTHGVTQYEANLAYWDQSGALNESISDVFGSLVKQFALGQKADEADWLIGAGLFAPGVHGVALRSMKAPGTAYDDPVIGKDPQPATMAGYVETNDDNGGVHINSGIPNHAFYLAAMAIGGYAWEKAGLIWYVTLRDRLHRTADFAEMGRLTIEVAGALFGVGSAEQKAVQIAWDTVGVFHANPTRAQRRRGWAAPGGAR